MRTSLVARALEAIRQWRGRNVPRAVARGRTVAPVSPEAWAAYALKRASPRLAGWIARKSSDSTR